jgi:hypothetical protein
VWWCSLSHDDPLEAPEWNWKDFQAAIRKQFSTDSDSLCARARLNTLHQSNWPVTKYNSEFCSLLLRISPPLSEEDKLERYFHGLNIDLVKAVAPQRHQ